MKDHAAFYARLGRVYMHTDSQWVMNTDEAERIWRMAEANPECWEAQSYGVSLRTALKLIAYERHYSHRPGPATIRGCIRRLVSAAAELGRVLHRRWTDC